MRQKKLELRPGIRSFSELEQLFSSKGVKSIYFKFLATKQDNEKNQIVLASSGSKNILTKFPAELSYRSPSKSTKKGNSKAGQPKIEMVLDFYWLSTNGSAHHAPNAKIINYFQYPEARFSGFLSGCEEHAPDALRRDHQHKYGTRILAFGANDDRKLFGLVLTERIDEVTSNFPDLHRSNEIPILLKHEVGLQVGQAPREKLKEELRTIAGIWHPSSILKSGNTDPVPFKGNQGAGFTLEALLGVHANADKAPDKHGFELKSFKKSGKISLMTPVADMGFEGENSFRKFLARYGWSGKTRADRTVFNGIFRYQKPKKTSAGHVMMLDLAGYNPDKEMFSQSEQDIFVSIADINAKELVSGWSLDKLLTSWNKKHSQACYVEYEKRSFQGKGSMHDAEYRFTGRVIFGEGTSVWDYLKSISMGSVYYDPAHEIRNNKSSVRPQWRISVTKKISQTLETLYDSVTEENLLD